MSDHAAVWIVEEEVKAEEILAMARQAHLDLSKEAARVLSFDWAHSPSLIDAAATAAAAAATAAAAASCCASAAAVASCCASAGKSELVGVFSRLDDGQEEEAKEEYHLPHPHHVRLLLPLELV